MKRKIFSSILVVLFLMLSVSSKSLAAENNDLSLKIYKDIMNDYMLVTDLDEEAANDIFNEINNGYDDDSIVFYTNQIINGDQVVSGDSYENIIYIQENYDSLIKGITSDAKRELDKYFLYHAIKYYEENGDINDNNVSDEEYQCIEAEAIMASDDSCANQVYSINDVLANKQAKNDNVAIVRVFADSTVSEVGSSGLTVDLGTHAWITITNISKSNITAGKLNIEPGKTISLGTWGNKSEHTGLWYGLESYMIKYYSAYNNRVSLQVSIPASTLSTLNSHIVGYDKWSKTNNCSSFAVSCWNKVSSTKLSAGVVNTPKNLANSIKKIEGYNNNFPVPHTYKVYYAQGKKLPIVSNSYN